MPKSDPAIAEAKQAALEVLRHNARGPFGDLPRTAAWGYPEPYTRDLMLSAPGFLLSGDAELRDAIRRTLETLAAHQSPHGQASGLAHYGGDLGSSDTTPLFLLGLAWYRQAVGKPDFLRDAAARALTWLEYQSPDDRVIVQQQPTTDWRDEQWVLGYGLYVNTLLYAALRLYRQHARAQMLRWRINRPVILDGRKPPERLEGLAIPGQPRYALWSFKVHSNLRFDLLGNSLAILTGIATPHRARRLIAWVEAECERLRAEGLLIGELPPVLFPYILPTDDDWHPRYERFNQPGTYHNGGVWPMAAGFYIAALVAAGRQRLAERKLRALTELVRARREADVAWGFSEWFQAQTGQPMGQDWQTWTAALYLYAAEAVEQRRTPFFDVIREGPDSP